MFFCLFLKMSTLAARTAIGKKFFEDAAKKFQEDEKQRVIDEAKQKYIKGRFHGNKPYRHLTNVPGNIGNHKALSVQHKNIKKKCPHCAASKKRKRG